MHESPTGAGPKPRVRLSDIVDAMDMQFDEMTTCLHRPTGQLVVVTSEARRVAEDGDDPGDHAWLAPEEVEAARELAEGSDDYVVLPGRFEIDEYWMMARFVRDVDDADARHDLERAIRGKGAFRYFKDTVHRLGLADARYAHRGRGYEEVARVWCEVNGIELEEARPES